MPEGLLYLVFLLLLLLFYVTRPSVKHLRVAATWASSRLLDMLSTIAVNRRGPPLLPCAKLGTLGLFRW